MFCAIQLRVCSFRRNQKRILDLNTDLALVSPVQKEFVGFEIRRIQIQFFYNGSEITQIMQLCTKVENPLCCHLKTCGRLLLGQNIHLLTICRQKWLTNTNT